AREPVLRHDAADRDPGPAPPARPAARAAAAAVARAAGSPRRFEPPGDDRPPRRSRPVGGAPCGAGVRGRRRRGGGRRGARSRRDRRGPRDRRLGLRPVRASRTRAPRARDRGGTWVIRMRRRGVATFPRTSMSAGARAARALAVAGFLALAAVHAHAKKFRYSAGPTPPADTLLSVSQPEPAPVRERGPRVPPTNLQLVSLVANQAIERAMADVPLGRGKEVLIAPAESHPLNFVVEHAILRQLSKRGVVALVHRSVVADSSLVTLDPADLRPVLDYQLASARVTYLRLRGFLPGRVKLERQALVEGRLTLRDPSTSRVLWTGDAS